jgi:uncharacterized protein (TIGR00255 family)
MIKSMTAYARATAGCPLGKLVIEILSINRKVLDLSLYLPKDFLRFDQEVRKALSKVLERGQITFRLNIQSEGAADQFLPPNLTQLKTLKETWEKLCLQLGYDPKEMIDLRFLLSQIQTDSSASTKEEEDLVQAALKQAIDAALIDLMQMKGVEGKVLERDVLERLVTIEEAMAAVELKKEVPLAHFQKKITDRLKELGLSQTELDERVIREVALLADRMDVTEELVRLKSHIEQFRGNLSSKERSVGRTLDFLTQEMHREINTLGAKSCDSEISICVVKIKSELDKIREQVQNIE